MNWLSFYLFFFIFFLNGDGSKNTDSFFDQKASYAQEGLIIYNSSSNSFFANEPIFVDSLVLQGGRPYQEDRYSIRRALNDGCFAIGLFDGHAGEAVSDALASSSNGLLDYLCHDQIIVNKDTDENSLIQAVKKAFIDYNQKFFKNHNQGSCAVVALFLYDKIVIAHVGDSRAICGDSKKIFCITNDHKPFLPNETKKVESGGGFVSFDTIPPRVNGMLAVSRAFGDAGIIGVTAEPDVTIIKKDQFSDTSLRFLIFASDGLWDELPQKIRHYKPLHCNSKLRSKIFEMHCNNFVDVKKLNKTVLDTIVDYQFSAFATAEIVHTILSRVLKDFYFQSDRRAFSLRLLSLASIEKENFDLDNAIHEITLKGKLDFDSKQDKTKKIEDYQKKLHDNQTILLVTW